MPHFFSLKGRLCWAITSITAVLACCCNMKAWDAYEWVPRAKRMPRAVDVLPCGLWLLSALAHLQQTLYIWHDTVGHKLLILWAS